MIFFYTVVILCTGKGLNFLLNLIGVLMVGVSEAHIGVVQYSNAKSQGHDLGEVMSFVVRGFGNPFFFCSPTNQTFFTTTELAPFTNCFYLNVRVDKSRRD